MWPARFFSERVILLRINLISCFTSRHPVEILVTQSIAIAKYTAYRERENWLKRLILTQHKQTNASGKYFVLQNIARVRCYRLTIACLSSSRTLAENTCFYLLHMHINRKYCKSL